MSLPTCCNKGLKFLLYRTVFLHEEKKGRNRECEFLFCPHLSSSLLRAMSEDSNGWTDSPPPRFFPREIKRRWREKENEEKGGEKAI